MYWGLAFYYPTGIYLYKVSSTVTRTAVVLESVLLVLSRGMFLQGTRKSSPEEKDMFGVADKLLKRFQMSPVLVLLSLLKKWSFPLRISSVNVTKSWGNCGFGHIYLRNPSWNTSFFVQCLLLLNMLLAKEKWILAVHLTFYRTELNWRRLWNSGISSKWHNYRFS